MAELSGLDEGAHQLPGASWLKVVTQEDQAALARPLVKLVLWARSILPGGLIFRAREIHDQQTLSFAFGLERLQPLTYLLRLAIGHGAC